MEPREAFDVLASTRYRLAPAVDDDGELVGILTRTGALRSTIFSLRALIRSYLRPGRWSFAAAARAVRVPTLVMWGTRDKLVDVRLAQPTSALFPDGRLLVIAGSGHVAQMEHPGPTAAAVAALWEDADAAPRIGRHPANLAGGDLHARPSVPGGFDDLERVRGATPDPITGLRAQAIQAEVREPTGACPTFYLMKTAGGYQSVEVEVATGASDGCRQIALGVRPGRSEVHAPPERLADNFLDRDDPHQLLVRVAQ